MVDNADAGAAQANGVKVADLGSKLGLEKKNEENAKKRKEEVEKVYKEEAKK